MGVSMSAVETTDAAVERVTLVRGFEFPVADAWDGRTLDVRIVPYDTPATVADPPHFTPYREAFMPGVFERQLSTPGRDKVWLNVEHEQGFRGAVGHSLRFSDAEDGLHGSFGLDAGADGDKALRLVTSGFLSGLSVEFRALASRRVDGVVQRLRAQLDTVSLCRYPAYDDARVLAVREDVDTEAFADEFVETHAEPRPPAPELGRSTAVDERLAALGFEPLEARIEPAELAEAAALLTRGRRTVEKAAEARKLIRHYNRAGLDAPSSLRALGRSA